MNKTYLYFIGGIILAVAVTLLVQNSITGKASYSVFQEDADDSSQYLEQVASEGATTDSAVLDKFNPVGSLGGDGLPIAGPPAPLPTKCADANGDYKKKVAVDSDSPTRVDCKDAKRNDECLERLIRCKDDKVEQKNKACEDKKTKILKEAGEAYTDFVKKCNLAGQLTGRKCIPEPAINKDSLAPCEFNFGGFDDMNNDTNKCLFSWIQKTGSWIFSDNCESFNPVVGGEYTCWGFSHDGEVSREFTCSGDQTTGTQKKTAGTKPE